MQDLCINRGFRSSLLLRILRVPFSVYSILRTNSGDLVLDKEPKTTQIEHWLTGRPSLRMWNVLCHFTAPAPRASTCRTDSIWSFPLQGGQGSVRVCSLGFARFKAPDGNPFYRLLSHSQTDGASGRSQRTVRADTADIWRSLTKACVFC